MKGLIIHTWERAWQYIKKAGTVILGISIILWAMMSFPSLSHEKMQTFEDERLKLRASFLALPEVKGLIKDEEALKALDKLFPLYQEALTDRDTESIRALEERPLFPVFEKIFSVNRSHSRLTSAYLRYREKMAEIDGRQHQASLKGTIAGRIGQGLEGITKPIGFDYRTNIALTGGFAAKEVIVSTLGTAYSLGEVDPEQSGSLSERLRSDPGWSPLVAFTLVLFSILYVPCFVTVISIRRESSWRWAGFSMGFNLIAAYLVCLMVYQLGVALGVGV